MKQWWQTLATLVRQLEADHIACCIVDEAALLVQGVALPTLPPITIAVQWDQFADAHRRYQSSGASAIDDHGRWAQFHISINAIGVSIICLRNTVVAADPNRMIVRLDDQLFPVKTLLFYRHTWAHDDPRVAAINVRLREQQHELTQQNATAWSQQDTYQAWVERYGVPVEAATRIVADPIARLAALNRHLGEVAGRRIINLMGSAGSKAVALALLGAHVTLVDIAKENIQYARELAQAAQVPVRCLVADVLALPGNERTSEYDLVLLELGILHYFVDLQPLAALVMQLLRPGGRLVLQDFHPISTKLITSKGRKHKVTGNYFDPALHETTVAYSKHLGPRYIERRVRLRRWMLGEIVTAFATVGLRMAGLFEEPNTKLDDLGIPKTFTLVAHKP